MSTELAVIPKSDFLVLQEDSDLREALECNLSEGETWDEADLVRVKNPSSGGKHFTVPDVSGDELAEAITGVVVHSCYRGVLWPAEEPAEGSTPVLISRDNLTAELVGEIPDDMIDVLADFKLGETAGGRAVYDWKNLPYCQFGTSEKGNGKRATDQRLFFVLRKGDAIPIQVVAGPGSIGDCSRWIKRLTVPIYRCIVEFSLQAETSKTGQKFSKIIPKLVGTLSKEDGREVKGLYRDPIADMVSRVVPVAGGGGDDD